MKIDFKSNTNPIQTSYAGCFTATFDELCLLLGAHNIGGSFGNKTQCEWSGTLNDIAFTIYDYKEYDIEIEVERDIPIEWHIGLALNENRKADLTTILNIITLALNDLRQG